MKYAKLGAGLGFDESDTSQKTHDAGDKPISHWLLSPPISLPVTELELLNLSPESDYAMIGIASEGNRSTQSAIQMVRTEGEGLGMLGTRINRDRLRAVAWFIAVLGTLGLALLIIAGLCYVAQRRHYSSLYEVRMREKQFSQSLR